MGKMMSMLVSFTVWIIVYVVCYKETNVDESGVSVLLWIFSELLFIWPESVRVGFSLIVDF